MDETKPLLSGPNAAPTVEQPPPYEEPTAPSMLLKPAIMLISVHT